MVNLSDSSAGSPAPGYPACGRCGRPAGDRAMFQFHLPTGGVIHTCLACAVRHRPMLRRSLLIALVIGTLLTLINHGDVLLGGHFPPGLLWKVPFTYLVPFLVASTGALANSRLGR